MIATTAPSAIGTGEPPFLSHQTARTAEEVTRELLQHVNENRRRSTHPRLQVSPTEDALLLLDVQSTSRLAPLRTSRSWTRHMCFITAFMLAVALLATWATLSLHEEDARWNDPCSWYRLLGAVTIPLLLVVSPCAAASIAVCGAIEGTMPAATEDGMHPNRRPFMALLLKSLLWQPLGSYPLVGMNMDEVFHAAVVLGNTRHWSRTLFAEIKELCPALRPHLGALTYQPILANRTHVTIMGRMSSLVITTALSRVLMSATAWCAVIAQAATVGTQRHGVWPYTVAAIEGCKQWLLASTRSNRLHLLSSLFAGMFLMLFVVAILLSLRSEYAPGSTQHLISLQWTRQQLMLHLLMSSVWQVAAYRQGLSIFLVTMVGVLHYVISVPLTVALEWAGWIQRRDLAFTQGGHAPAARPWTVWMRIWQDSAARGHLCGTAACSICLDSMSTAQKPSQEAKLGILLAAIDWEACPPSKRLPLRGWQFDPRVIQLLSCGHAFHARCMIAHETSLPHWPARCPTCRAAYSSLPLMLVPRGQACPSSADQVEADVLELAPHLFAEMIVVAYRGQAEVASRLCDSVNAAILQSTSNAVSAPSPATTDGGSVAMDWSEYEAVYAAASGALAGPGTSPGSGTPAHHSLVTAAGVAARRARSNAQRQQGGSQPQAMSAGRAAVAAASAVGTDGAAGAAGVVAPARRRPGRQGSRTAR